MLRFGSLVLLAVGVGLPASIPGLFGSYAEPSGSVDLATGINPEWQVFDNAPTSASRIHGLTLTNLSSKPLHFEPQMVSGFSFLQSPGDNLTAPTIHSEREGFLIKLPAKASERVLRVYVGVAGGTALVRAFIPEEETHYYTDTSFSSAGTMVFRCYTINYESAHVGRDVQVEVSLMVTGSKKSSSLCLLALQSVSAAGNIPPVVRLMLPPLHATFQAPANITVEAEAHDPDGRVSKVEFYDFSHALKIGESAQAPYRITVKRPTSWYGSICATAYDDKGRAVDSKPVQYSVVDSTRQVYPSTGTRTVDFVSKGLPFGGWEGVSSMAELPNGDIVTVWYGGSYELSSNSSVFLSRLKKGKREWTTPKSILKTPNLAAGNAVLLYYGGKLWCFFSKPFGNAWEFARLFYSKSTDGGETWSNETAITTPSFPYPTGTMVSTAPQVLQNGDIVLPLNRESYDPDPKKQWFSLFLISSDGGKTWHETAPLYSFPGNIQPAVTQIDDGELLSFFRVRGQSHFLWRSTSSDNARTWAPLVQSAIRNPSARIALARLPDGKLVMAFNDNSVYRIPLNLSLSADGGQTWSRNRVIEGAGYASTYPYLLVSTDGTIHCTYNDNYHAIKHVTVDEKWFDEE